MSKTKTILVTGGAGFIGSHVAASFLAQGHRVLILDDLSSGTRENVPEGAELHIHDIRSEDAAALIVQERIEVVSHHAAQMDVRRSTEDPGFDASVNILGTLNLLEACRSAGTGQMIFASTGGAIYGEQDTFPADESHPTRPVSPYGVSKLAAERYLYYFHHEYGLNATCLRYANVYGERQNPHGEAGVVAIFMNKILGGEQPVINGDGLQTRDYIHVSNVAAANRAALSQEGFQTFNVGTGIETSVVELFAGISTSLGSDVTARHGKAMPGEQRRSVIDPGASQRAGILGDVIDLPEGLAKTADWFRRRATVATGAS